MHVALRLAGYVAGLAGLALFMAGRAGRSDLRAAGALLLGVMFCAFLASYAVALARAARRRAPRRRRDAREKNAQDRIGKG